MLKSLFWRLWNRRRDYRAVFDTDEGQRVLADLRGFCRVDSTCVIVGKDGKIDTHATMVAEGRREVFLRIVEILRLTDEQLHKLKEMNDDD
jgi:hypothetical protein